MSALPSAAGSIASASMSYADEAARSRVPIAAAAKIAIDDGDNVPVPPPSATELKLNMWQAMLSQRIGQILCLSRQYLLSCSNDITLDLLRSRFAKKNEYTNDLNGKNVQVKVRDVTNVDITTGSYSKFLLKKRTSPTDFSAEQIGLHLLALFYRSIDDRLPDAIRNHGLESLKRAFEKLDFWSARWEKAVGRSGSSSSDSKSEEDTTTTMIMGKKKRKDIQHMSSTKGGEFDKKSRTESYVISGASKMPNKPSRAQSVDSGDGVSQRSVRKVSPVLKNNSPMRSSSVALGSGKLPVVLSKSRSIYFTDLICSMTLEQYGRHVRMLSKGNKAVCEDMMIQLISWHNNRASGNINVLQMMTKLHEALSPSSPWGIQGLSDVNVIYGRWASRKHHSRLQIAPPDILLPPTMKPVNIHSSGNVGQCCIQGKKKCFAFRNGMKPNFAPISFYLGGSGIVQQQCHICNECYNAHYGGFDPNKTFDREEDFHEYMSAVAAKMNFIPGKLGRGALIDIGSAKAPKIIGTICSKRSPHRPKDCDCPVKVSARLVRNANGFKYHFNHIQLDHDHKTTHSLSVPY